MLSELINHHAITRLSALPLLEGSVWRVAPPTKLAGAAVSGTPPPRKCTSAVPAQLKYLERCSAWLQVLRQVTRYIKKWNTTHHALTTTTTFATFCTFKVNHLQNVLSGPLIFFAPSCCFFFSVF